jgi:hypothetical protein
MTPVISIGPDCWMECEQLPLLPLQILSVRTSSHALDVLTIGTQLVNTSWPEKLKERTWWKIPTLSGPVIAECISIFDVGDSIRHGMFFQLLEMGFVFREPQEIEFTPFTCRKIRL